MSARKRARSLRRLNRDEADALVGGGLVDESIPDPEIGATLESFGVNVDREAFMSFLRHRVGFYRSLKENQESQPTTAREVELVAETMEIIQELRTRLDHLPPDASAHADLVCWKHRKELFHDHTQRLDAELQLTWNMLAMTERELEKQRGKGRGAKRKLDRDWFLSDVTEWLTTNAEEMTLLRACEVTHELCISLRVEVPEYTSDSPNELADIIRAWRKRE